MLNKEQIKNIRIDSNLVIHYKFNNPNRTFIIGRFSPQECSINCFVSKKTLKKIVLNINGKEKVFNIDDFSQNGTHGVDSLFYFYLESV